MRLPIFVIIICLVFFSGCNEVPEKSSAEINASTPVTATSNYSIGNGDFAHTVYFWLNNPDNAEDRTAFETSLKKFILNSPDITTRHIGTPAATQREVIDNSYTYSLLLTFKDKAAQDRYQEDPAHKLFIEESSELWSKVLVYDSENVVE